MNVTSKDQKKFYDEEFKTLASPAMEASIRDFYFQEIVSILGDRFHPGGRALEVGCGNGMLMEKMRERYPDSSFEGFDISEKNVTMARKRGLDVSVGNADNMSLEGGYDLVYGSAVLHHLQDIGAFFEQVAALLNDGGVILFGPEPVSYQFIYIIWHKLRRIWEIEKGMLNITEKKMRLLLAGSFENVRISRHGNAFVYSVRPVGRTWNALRLSKVPSLNDIYIYAEKRTR